MSRSWLSSRSQQWVIAVLLAASLAYELPLPAGVGLFLPTSDAWWLMLGGVPMIAPALLVSRWPVGAGVAAFGVLVGWSLTLRVVKGPWPDPVSPTATVAMMVIIVVVVRGTAPRTAAALVALLVVGGHTAELIHDPWPDSLPDLLWNWIGSSLVVFGVAVAVGLYLRSLDVAAARRTEGAVTAARQRERLGLARELHDVVAHHIGGIVVQAQAAQVVAGTAAETRVLPVIERAGTDALAAMRLMVSALREGDLDGDHPFRTTDLTADLHAVTAGPGRPPVRLTVDLAEPVPGEVGTSVLRLVQESVTNARRYATGARSIDVTVRAADGSVQVVVADDGHPGGPRRQHGGGFGLIGMRERVTLLGGRFAAGRRPEGGWQVHAELPTTVPTT